MPKKMHDILPPKAKSKKPATAKKVRAVKKAALPEVAVKMPMPVEKEPQKEMVHATRTYRHEKRGFPWVKTILIGGAIAVLALGMYAYIKLPKADIQISVKTDAISLQDKVTAETSATVANASTKVIPAQYVQFEKDSQQDFPSTGMSSSDSAATGVITVYNKIDPSTPFTLIKGTHFLSDSGKFFVTLSKVVIPAATRKNGSLVAGSINVNVQAQDVGTDYNIGASKFSIPKLSGTAYYYSVYGASADAMSGGSTGNVKIVTSDDIQTAQDVLTKKLLADAQTALQAKLGADDVLVDGASINTITSTSSSVKAGAVADTFTESAKAQISALVFKKEDLDSIIQNEILAQVPAGNNVLQNSLQINSTASGLDTKAGKMTLAVNASANTYYNVSASDLANQFRDKSSNQIQQLVGQIYQDKVSQLSVNFWPFWVTRAPGDAGRITVKLSY